MNRASKYIVLKYLKQEDLLVIVFKTTKLKYKRLNKNKIIY